MADRGGPLPLNTYTLDLEVSREHGTHAMELGKIECGKLLAKGMIAGDLPTPWIPARIIARCFLNFGIHSLHGYLSMLRLRVSRAGPTWLAAA